MHKYHLSSITILQSYGYLIANDNVKSISAIRRYLGTLKQFLIFFRFVLKNMDIIKKTAGGMITNFMSQNNLEIPGQAKGNERPSSSKQNGNRSRSASPFGARKSSPSKNSNKLFGGEQSSSSSKLNMPGHGKDKGKRKGKDNRRSPSPGGLNFSSNKNKKSHSSSSQQQQQQQGNHNFSPFGSTVPPDVRAKTFEGLKKVMGQ